MRPSYLFIIGAAKAGTTSLQSMLKEHPEIFFSPIKEPNHFCTDIKTSEFSREYRRNTFLDLEHYFSQKKPDPMQLSFVEKRVQYLKLFDGAEKDHQILAEASTSYLFSKNAAKEIYHFRPDSRIVAILRNPAERAFSHYLMGLRYGYTSKKFRDEFESDIKQKRKGWGISRLYYELGLYSDQLKRYYDIFPKDQIKVFLFEELIEKTGLVLHEIFEFLDIGKPAGDLNSKKENKASVPKNYLLNSFIVKTGLKSLLKKVLKEKTLMKIKSGFFKSDKLPMLSKQDRVYLQQLYKDDIEKTASVINRDLSSWLA